jgi:peroxiredoxin/uncharacterized membrane protein YphA (DoxX/SURF4 family)
VDIVILLMRLVLVGVFGLAAVTKLADLAGSRTALEGFGLPKRLAAPVGIALPFVELAIALLLLPVFTSWWGAVAGLILLLAFIAGIGYTLSQGRTPDCHCFGQVYSEPVGKPTLVRNGILAALAAVLVLRGPDGQGASLMGWLDDVSTTDRVILGLVLLALAMAGGLAWLLLQLLQQNGRLLVRIEALEAGGPAAGVPVADSRPPAGLPVGTAAPAFSLPRLDGETVSLDHLRAGGKPVLLLFTDPGCGPCGALLPEIGRWQQEHAQALTIALVSRGTREANAAKAGEHGISRVLLQQDREVSEAYQSVPTPSAVLVRPDGTIMEPAALGAEAIRALVTRATTRQVPVIPSPNGNGHHPAPAPSHVGEPAPAVTLPDLDGEPVSLEAFKGEPTLVLFWNPGCGFCSRMLDDLKAWEADPPAGAPKLLVVSTGSVEANQAMGLRSTVVLDEAFVTGRAFGVSGTPSAVLVDAEGRIASAPAVGAPAVLALANTGAAGVRER